MDIFDKVAKYIRPDPEHPDSRLFRMFDSGEFQIRFSMAGGIISAAHEDWAELMVFGKALQEAGMVVTIRQGRYEDGSPVHFYNLTAL